VIGALAMALSMIVVAILSAIYDDTMAQSSLRHSFGTAATAALRTENRPATYTMLVFLCVFIAFFALSWGPVGWICKCKCGLLSF
jgi:hypothetical protein